MTDFKLTPLHRRRRGRRKSAAVLSDTELAALFGTSIDALAHTLQRHGWQYHRDSSGRIWASEQPLTLTEPTPMAPDQDSVDADKA